MTQTQAFSKVAGRWWQAIALLMPSRPATPHPKPADPPAPPRLEFRTREMAPGEEGILADLFVSSVRELGAQAYSEEQVRIWSSFGTHFAEFQARLQGGHVIVAEGGVEAPERILGFGQLETDGHLSLLYTCPRAVRQGVATRVYGELEAAARREGVKRIYTEASHLSRGFFAKQGFRLVAEEVVERGGMTFERFRMEKALRGSAA